MIPLKQWVARSCKIRLSIIAELLLPGVQEKSRRRVDQSVKRQGSRSSAITTAVVLGSGPFLCASFESCYSIVDFLA